MRPHVTQADLAEAIERGDRVDFLYFWGHEVPSDGQLTNSCLSQWYPSPFTVEGVRYATAEHWMMAEKARRFGDDAALAKILEAPTPRRAKALGRGVRHFDRAVWDAARFSVVVRGSVHKFGSSPALRDFLLGTGERVLVEASPTDRIWGIGCTKAVAEAHGLAAWRGRNLLGFALMEARARLLVTAPSAS